MKKSKVLFGVLFSTLILAGGVTTAAVSKENEPVAAKATSNPNNMFGYIFNDSYNNQNNSLTLFVFEGTSTGLADTTNFPEQRDLVKINGVSCSTLAVWGGHNWFQVTYPTSSSYEGATLEFTSGIVAGDAVLSGCRFVMNSSLKWEFAGFNDSPTASYYSIPYSAYNKSTELLIKYSGAETMLYNQVTNSHDIYNYDNYLTINGNPLSSLSGGKIRSWMETTQQQWLWLQFPAASVGDVLDISEGMRFYNVVFRGMRFVFNSSGQWEYVSLTKNDPSVSDYDYEMFTFDDYAFASNDAKGFVKFPSSPGIIDAMSKSFCLQFNVDLESTSCNTTLFFAGTDIYGSSPVFSITLDFANNVYLTFNGSIDWATSKTTSWSAGVHYLVEVYAIRTSETSCDIILGRDGVILFKATKDISAVTFNNNLVIKGTENTASNYSACLSTKGYALERFGVRKLKSEYVPFANNRDTGACLSYYGEAKSYYNNYLAKTQKEAFVSDSAYSELKARLSAWAAANGETFIASGTGSFSSARFNPIFNDVSDVSTIVIIVTSAIMLGAAGFFFLFRKKKER